MTDAFLEKLEEARSAGGAFCIATVAKVTGSTPRHAGAKMLIYGDGRAWGTIGGGKFEALVVEGALAALASGEPLLKTFPLHESDPESFGAICGGEVTVLIEPCGVRERLMIIGGGHCGAALARMARECGMHVTLVDDRAQVQAGDADADRLMTAKPAEEVIQQEEWTARSALVLVSRNFALDRDALAAALPHMVIGYIGMIGSRRKVRRVFDELRERGFSDADLARVYAPIGLDIGADSPAEIAVSVLAEVLLVLRGRAGTHLKTSAS